MVRSTAGGTIGTVTCPGSIVTTAGHLALGRIEVLDTTHVHFMIDNDSSDGVSFLDCGTVSGTLPTAQLSPFVEDNQSGAQGATHNIDVDYYRIWQDDSSGSVGSEAPIVGDASTPTTTDQKGIIDFQNATADDTTFDHDVYVKGTLYADKIKANQIEGLNVFTDQLDSLQKQLANEGASPSSASGSGASTSTGTTPTPASGLSFNMSSDLQTGGGLTVGGDAQFMGNAFFYKLVTFVEKTVFKNDISLEGHFATAGDAPTVAPGDTAGLQTAPTDGTPANLASVSISGNDTAGQLSVTLGDGAAAGNLAKISFKKPFGKAPRILLTPANDAASKMKYYVQSSNNDFTLASPDTLQAGTNISFNYWVIE